MNNRLYKAERLNGEGVVKGYYCKIGETITGAIIPDGIRHYIIPENTTSLNGAIEVQPKSITQHTGQTDRNGVDIWDNSHLRVSLRDKVRIGCVFYDKHLACHSVKFSDGQVMKFSEIFSAKNTDEVWVEVCDLNSNVDAVTPKENKEDGVESEVPPIRNGRIPYVTVIDHTNDETFPKSDGEEKPSDFDKSIKKGSDALCTDNPEIVDAMI